MDCEEKEWFNVTEAAEYLGISRNSVYTLMDSGRLPYYEIKGLRAKRIKRRDLDALLKRVGGGEDGNDAVD